MDKSRGARLDKEIKDQTTGPSRLEFAEKEKEYKKKWLEGIQKLEKSKISLYQLPWYLLLGEPGGGKTMTLLNSGMDFPLGKEELPGFGGTRNYNWWFTNYAVILDTAGRLVFEQEGTTDRHEWEAFLKLLKKRRRCPLNGVIIALPADKLMSDTTEERHQSASILRDRLRQIQTVLDVRFPVFLLITKCDLIAGFTEFYNELDSLQRNQLFGWSRPGEFDTPFEPAEFKGGFEELYARLHELRLRFLARQTTDTEAGWIYTFPEAFRALQNRLQECMDVLFTKNIFAEPLFFRGFYFTSSLQEGKPILDLLGANLSDEKLEDLQGLFPQSRAFFIHDFYTQKVAKEQGMVFRSQKHIKRMRLLRNSTLFAGAPLTIALAVFTFFGYRAYSATVQGPREVVAAAADLIGKYREKQEAGEAWAVDVGDSNDQEEALRLSQMLDDAIRPKPLDVIGIRQGREMRPLALDEGHIHAQGIGNHQNIGKQDRRVHPKALNRLQGRLGGQRRRIAELEERPGLAAQPLVLGQVAPRLAHQPHRRRCHGLAMQGAEQGLARFGDRQRRDHGNSGSSSFKYYYYFVFKR